MPIGTGSKPNHRARAVNLATAFPPAPAGPTRRPTRPDARNSTHAAPMRNGEREGAYRAQTGRRDLTPRQRRRAAKKANHSAPDTVAA